MYWQTFIFIMMFLPSSYALAIDLNNEPLQIIPNLQIDSAKAQLGERLFFDTRLSKNNSIACAHCHDLSNYGGADNLKHSFGVNGREGTVNSPTVFNAAFNSHQFWDGRANSLEEQIEGPLNAPLEMDSNWSEVIKSLKADKAYLKDFQRLYTTGINANTIKHAIAEFERSLITPNSRFDQYLLGNETALSSEEKHGYQLFKSYGCTACHQGKNVGGNLFQTLGVMNDYFADHPTQNKAALGRFNVTGLSEDRHRFKVPSLRLVVLTAPYFHNGSIQSLAEAIQTMGKYQLGRYIPDKDVRSIICFLYSLPGTYKGQSLEPKDRKQLNFNTSKQTAL